MTNTSLNKRLDELQATLHALQLKLEEPRPSRLPRGTGDHTSAAAVASMPVPARLALAMAGRVTTPELLAEELQIDAAEVRRLVALMPNALAVVNGTAGAVCNLATDYRPRWVLTIGDDTGTDELVEAVRQALRERPMTQAELVEAVGARRNRVSGAIVKLQALDEPIENHGSAGRARWFYSTKV